MTEPEQTTLPAVPADPAPQAEGEVAKPEGKGSVLKRELAEMRVIGDRLEALEPESRKRVLRWLTEHYCRGE